MAKDSDGGQDDGHLCKTYEAAHTSQRQSNHEGEDRDPGVASALAAGGDVVCMAGGESR